MSRYRRGDMLVDVNPMPGQGGYTQGTGPTNEYGFGGSGPAAPWTHGQGPTDIQHQQATVTGNQAEWDNRPDGNWTGQVLRHVGLDPDRRDDTEVRGNITIGHDVPGSSNQRNSVCYNREAKPDGTNRYVYGGREGGPYVAPGTAGNPVPSGSWNEAQLSENGGASNAVYAPRVGGGQETPFFQRRMPYGGRNGDGSLGGARGSQNSGWRFYMAPGGQFGGWHPGHYGLVRAAGPRHRPTVFAEPAPWTQTYYDTTASTGSPAVAGSGGQALAGVYLSPEVPRGNWRRGG